MKRMIEIFSILFLAGCASWNPSPESLRQDPSCKIWTKNALGFSQVADIDEKSVMARQQVTCWIQNMFLCTYNKYTFKDESQTTIKSSILGEVGRLDGNRMSYKMTGAQTDPFIIDGGKVEYQVTGLIGPKRTKTVEYNKACSTKMVALGILALAAI